MKKIILAFVMMTMVWGCKNKETKKNVTQPKVTKTSTAVTKKADKKGNESMGADIPEEIKAKYEDLAVKIECIRRTEKDPKIMREKMEKLFAINKITEKEYNIVVPRLKIKDSGFVERLASGITMCVRSRLPQKPIDATGNYMGKFVTNGINSTLTLNINKAEVSANLLIDKKLYKMKGTVTDKGLLSLEYKADKDSIIIKGNVNRDSTQFSGMLRGKVGGKNITARLSALKITK